MQAGTLSLGNGAGASSVPIVPISNANTTPSNTLAQLYAQMQQPGVQSSMGTSTTHSTTQGNQSASLESSIADWMAKQNQVGQQTTDAYNNYQQTFNDVINSNNQMGRAQGSRNASALGTSALASGMNPYEAQGAMNTSFHDSLASLMQSLAGLKGQQAEVGVQGAKAQSDLNTGYGNFLQGVVAPYQMQLAGTQTNSTTTDPSKYYSLLATLAQAMSTDKYQMGNLAVQNQQNQNSANTSLWNYLAQLGSTSASTQNAQTAANASAQNAASQNANALTLQQMRDANALSTAQIAANAQQYTADQYTGRNAATNATNTTIANNKLNPGISAESKALLASMGITLQ